MESESEQLRTKAAAAAAKSSGVCAIYHISFRITQNAFGSGTAALCSVFDQIQGVFVPFRRMDNNNSF